LTASAKDRRVEPFWHALRAKKTAESLKRLRPALIATPNFSLHADTVPHDNLLSMKRIAKCFEEFAAVGLPVAVHVNSRTPHDFGRWAKYLIASPAIYAIAYEMGTIGRSPSRCKWHAQQLIELAHNVGRPLTLLIRAGSRHLPQPACAFGQVIFLDTTAHMNAKMRQRARRIANKLAWTASPTASGEDIDALLMHNIRAWRSATRELLSTREVAVLTPQTADHTVLPVSVTRT
jgi:hypothetical protein